ncbi:MAG: SRPBCC family protein [Rhizobacter sp.]|nr:SRPBCC family protein [Rhizobacter sp.]
MLKTMALVLVVAVAAVLAFAATRPDTFRIQREVSIKAAPEVVFALINDFHRWQAWSPWEKLDPAMQRSHSGAASGVGAVYAWEGSGKVGAGRMEITDSAAPAKLTIQLDFIKPFTARNTAEFSMKGEGETTRVQWAMHGASPYISKLMGVFFNMDKLIGADFEAGLANLKAAAEKN